MLATYAAFIFIINQDAMTDAKTFEARVGDERASVSILCGQGTQDQPVVEFKASSELDVFSDRRASVEYRFDAGEAEKQWPHWKGDRAILTGKEAAAFADAAASATRIRTRIRLASGEYEVFDAPAVADRSAIGRVLQACRTQ